MVIVDIMFNGATFSYKFDMSLESFIKIWDNHNAGVGYFTGEDVDRKTIIINPSHCGAIEMREVS